MPPIMLTRPERAALRRLAKGALPASEIRPQYAQKLVEHDLAVRETLRLKITAKGQLELLRQRYRKMPAPTKATAGYDLSPRVDQRPGASLPKKRNDREPPQSLPG